MRPSNHNASLHTPETCLLSLELCLLQVCIQLQMCPAPSLFGNLHRTLVLPAEVLRSKFASFSTVVISTPTVTGIATISSSSDTVEDTADSSDVHPSKLVRAKAKVHGPGLALPMAS